MLSSFAVGGLDFVPLNTTLTFGPGVTMATNTVFLMDDELSEGLERFTIDIVLVNEALGDPGVLQTATVLLFDNEGECEGCEGCAGGCTCGGPVVWGCECVCVGGCGCSDTYVGVLRIIALSRFQNHLIAIKRKEILKAF